MNLPKRDIHPIQLAIATANGQRVDETATLQLRISVQGRRDPGFTIRLPDSLLGGFRNTVSPINNYGSILTIDPKLWDTKRGCLMGRSEEVAELNNELLRIKLKIREIYSLQLERYVQQIGPAPTTESVKEEYLSGAIALSAKGRLATQRATIVGGLDAYYHHLLAEQDTELALSEKSLEKRRYVRTLLIKFLAYEETPNLESKQINQGWAKRFASWLTQERKMATGTARMYVGVIRQTLAFLVEQDQLPVNPLIGLKLAKGKKKPVVWLSPEQVEALWQIDQNTPIGITAFWLKVIVLTGMDYVDAVRYVQNRSDYECMGIGGRKIVINRGKNGSECHIPFTDKLDKLLAGPIPHAYGIDCANLNLKILAPLIGFSHQLTTKTGRKTAGAIWLLEGYSIHEISRFLGHSSIAMTESHYVKTSGLTADRGMQRINQNNPALGHFSQFLRIHNVS